MVRLFVAIQVTDSVKKIVTNMQDELNGLDAFEGKFVNPNNMHVTLKFFGNIKEENIEKIDNLLTQIKFKCFKIKLKNKLDFFTKNKIKVIWIGLNSPEFEQLQQKIENIFSCEFINDNGFKPHLTIARVKSVNNKKKLLEFMQTFNFEQIEFEVNCFGLFSSMLSSDGPKYEKIKNYDLLC